ncbi:MAG: alpha/beta fold hydrolase [Acidimicrobiia bacterium]|nr:alpha/beta fold hydrolase [Acidimicrobiia bacterium]
MNEFRNGDLVFDVRDEGPEGGDLVILLHGFPETKASWNRVVPLLTAAGYRVLAPDQRGYSPRARPQGRRAYVADNLVADVLALADAAEADRFHVVGHDWGGAVAWYAAMWEPQRLKTLTSLATPHPKAFSRSLLTSTQLLRSLYFLAFQLPALPERMLTSDFGRRRFRTALTRSGLPEEAVDSYLVALSGKDAMTAVLNWYRAAALTPPRRQTAVSVPTLYVYGTKDIALGPKAADRTREYVNGPYRYERLDSSHWLPEEEPDAVARLVLEHVGS